MVVFMQNGLEALLWLNDDLRLRRLWALGSGWENLWFWDRSFFYWKCL